MLVSRRRDAQATTQRPQPDADQRCADQALAPRRQEVDRRQDLAQEDTEQCDDDDTRGMTETPGPPGDPALATAVDRKRRNRGEVIRTGQYVKEPGDSASEDGQHRRSNHVMALGSRLSALGSWLLALGSWLLAFVSR
jgi:hypothetical protein